MQVVKRDGVVHQVLCNTRRSIRGMRTHLLGQNIAQHCKVLVQRAAFKVVQVVRLTNAPRVDGRPGAHLGGSWARRGNQRPEQVPQAIVVGIHALVAIVCCVANVAVLESGIVGPPRLDQSALEKAVQNGPPQRMSTRIIVVLGRGVLLLKLFQLLDVGAKAHRLFHGTHRD